MKKIVFLSMSCALLSLTSIAQSTFPVNGNNTGVGTVSPTARFVVQSNSGQTEDLAKFKVSDAPNDYFQISNATGTVNQFIPTLKGHHESDNRPSIYVMGSTSDNNDNGGHSIVTFDARRPAGPIQTRPLFSWTSYTTKMMTMTANGKLGIGTTTPSSKLEVRGVIKTSYSNDRHVSLFNSGDGNSYINIVGGATNSRFGFQIDGGSKMSILKNGNVGIGTSSPDSKLAVNGKIHAKEVKVDLSIWPDYVFEHEYNLQTLEEVENHIIEKGHLPDIPSAEEVTQNGIQLGEMNAKLLQKIEELTIYMIEQNKKTAKLQKEVTLLKQKNLELEKKIK
ncbi:hypothetical protein [Aquimarina sp. I32.4]|uniref:hypothetical protein n=1 Tax=Aquimarina sp. I32.4 TaxID=2053903 RepID=UPI0011AFA730|nr:hypothetical protein [Aquimarina sp. I32.4]